MVSCTLFSSADFQLASLNVVWLRRFSISFAERCLAPPIFNSVLTTSRVARYPDGFGTVRLDRDEARILTFNN